MVRIGKWLKGLVGKNVEPAKEADGIIRQQGVVDYSMIENVEVVGNENGKVLLVMDDVKGCEDLYTSDFDALKRQGIVDVMGEYKVVMCFGANAGYMALKYMLGTKVDYAILDITLGTSKRTTDGDVIHLDGIDIALELIRNHEGVSYKFSTAHTMNRRTSYIARVADKFESVSGLCIDDYYMDKNGDREQGIAELLGKV